MLDHWKLWALLLPARLTGSSPMNCFTRGLVLAGGHVCFTEDVLSLIPSLSLWWLTQEMSLVSDSSRLIEANRPVYIGSGSPDTTSGNEQRETGDGRVQVHAFRRHERQLCYDWKMVDEDWMSSHNGSYWFLQAGFFLLMASLSPHILPEM